ncbi:MAG: pseudouridine synthase [Phycisphaerales bacterium]
MQNRADNRVRLQRVMADAGVASRRECERLIEDGGVSVNGRVVRTMPVLVDPFTDEIRVQGRILPRLRRGRDDRASPRTRRYYIMVNKPARVLSATRDDPAFADAKGRGRPTVLDLVSLPDAPRLFPVGRLDFHATGLVLLTNDGDLAQRLTHARYGVPKTYEVLVKRRVTQDEVEQLAAAITRGALSPAPGRASRGSGGRRPVAVEPAARRRSRRVDVALIKYDDDRSFLRVTMPEGANRSVVEVLDRLGFHVKKLRRIGIGPVSLTGVALGQWRPLTLSELRRLKSATRHAGDERPGTSPAPPRPAPPTPPARRDRARHEPGE